MIRKTDQWVVFDVVKYQAKSWMNRNRILEPNSGEQYVSVPVDKSTGRMLDHIQVKDAPAAGEKILRQLVSYKHCAPYYAEVHDLVAETFGRFGEGGLLRDLNVLSLALSCERLGIAFDHRNCSELDLDLANVGHAGQWALEISSQLGANCYVNPSGGRDIFVPHEWRNRGIELRFTRLPDFRYSVAGKLSFRPNLSILDCLMWNEPGQIRDYLDTLALDES